MRFTQKVSWLPSRLPCKWTFQSRKTLRQIFQIFSQGFLETWFGDLFATHFSRKNRVFCALRTVFPSLTLTVHCLVRSSLSQTHRVSLKNPPFSSSSRLQTSRKGMGFLSFSKYFMFIACNFLIFEVLLRFEKCDVRIWVGFIFLSLLNGFC